MDIAWPIIVAAGLLEPAWVFTMKRSENFRRIGWALATAAVIIADIYLLSIAMQTIGAGISYAVWTGIGAVSTFFMGVAIYKEPVTVVRCLFIMLIIAGIVGLNLTAGGI